MEGDKEIKNVGKTLDDNQLHIDEISKQVLGYGSVVEQLLDPTVQKIDFGGHNIVKDKSLVSDLFNMKGKDKSTNNKYGINEHIYSTLDAPNIEYGEFAHALSGRSALNTEFNFLMNSMIELQSAVDMLADDVIFPNVSTDSGVKVEFVNNDETKEDETREFLMQYLRPDIEHSTLNNSRKFNYNIEDDIREIINDFAIYGHRIIANIPYKKIAQDLLYDYNKEDKVLSSAGEAYDIMQKTYNKKSNKGFKESLNMDKLSSIIDPDSNKVLRNIISDVPYSERDVDYLNMLIENNPEEYFEPIKAASPNINGNLTDLLKPVGESEYNSIELASIEKIKEKQKRKFNIDKLVGCTHDELDPNKTIPVYIKDTIMGVYVIEDTQVLPNALRLGPNISNLIGASTLFDENTPRTGVNTINKLKTLIHDDIRKILVSNLDKNLLKNNPNIIEDIEFVLRNNSDMTSPKIKFIPSEYLTIHKIGKGPLGMPLLYKARIYAHYYIQLLKSDLSNKMFFEKPRWIVKLPFDGDTSNQARITQSINSFRHSIPRLSDIAIPDKVNNSSASYHTVIMPLNNENQEAYTIDQLPAMDSRDNSEYLRLLRNQVTMTIGYPADLFDPSQHIDFAKKIANINMTQLIRILNIQKQLSVSLSEMSTKRIRYMTGNEHIEVRITFEPPAELSNTVSQDVFNQINTKSDIYFALIDKDPRIKDEHREQVKQLLNKKLLKGVLDTDLLDECILEVATFKEGTRQIE